MRAVPRGLKVPALLCLLAAPAHAEEPPSCGDIVLLASAEEVAATPRERLDVEYLALEMGGGFTADPAVYRRVLADTDAIRALVPAVDHVTYVDRNQTSDSFLLQLDGPTHAAVLAGAFDGWDCLNDWYGIEVTRVFDSIPWAVMEALGAYDLDAMITQYNRVPGIVSGTRNGIAYVPGFPLPPTICGIWSAPSTYHYFFDNPGFRDAWIHYFTTSTAGRPRLHGSWDRFADGPPPPWTELFDFCQAGGSPLPSTLSVDPPAPTADDEIVLTAAGIGSSSCRPVLDRVTIDPAERAIRVTADVNAACVPCTEDLAPYSFEAPLGQLAAGDYRVTWLNREGCEDTLSLEAAIDLTVAPGAGDGARCAGGDAPAATLLFPYFEVDLDDPEGENTLLAIQNTAPEPTLARVVLWTDRGLPTLGFTLYLPGDGAQTLSLRDVFAHGNVPVTGSGTGSIEGAPGCSDPIANPRLDATGLAALQAQHRGLPSPADGLCWGSDRGGGALAVGYVTVDAVDDCSDTVLYPGDDGYFETGGDGLASLRNVLWGDVFYLDSSQDSAQGLEAVAIPAEASLGEGRPTFYYGLSDGRDQRLPLASTYRARYLRGGGLRMATDLIVWSEGFATRGVPQVCDDPGAGGFSIRLNATVRDLDGAVSGLESFRLEGRTLKVAVGGESLPVDADFGQIDVVTYLTCDICSPPGFFPLQARVIPVMSAAGRFSVALGAMRLTASCP